MTKANWRKSLTRFVERFEGTDLTRAFEEVDRVISEGFAENFMRKVDNKGAAWPPRKDNLPHPLLIKTGNMFRAATEPTHPGHLFRVSANSNMTISLSNSVVPYAKFHHYGTSRMPQRRVIYATRAKVKEALDAFEEAATRQIMQDNLRQAGF